MMKGGDLTHQLSNSIYIERVTIKPKSTWIKEVERDVRGTRKNDFKQKTSNRKLWNKIFDKV